MSRIVIIVLAFVLSLAAASPAIAQETDGMGPDLGPDCCWSDYGIVPAADLGYTPEHFLADVMTYYIGDPDQAKGVFYYEEGYFQVQFETYDRADCANSFRTPSEVTVYDLDKNPIATYPVSFHAQTLDGGTPSSDDYFEAELHEVCWMVVTLMG